MFWKSYSEVMIHIGRVSESSQNSGIICRNSSRTGSHGLRNSLNIWYPNRDVNLEIGSMSLELLEDTLVEHANFETVGERWFLKH